MVDDYVSFIRMIRLTFDFSQFVTKPFISLIYFLNVIVNQFVMCNYQENLYSNEFVKSKV